MQPQQVTCSCRLAYSCALYHITICNPTFCNDITSLAPQSKDKNEWGGADHMDTSFDPISVFTDRDEPLVNAKDEWGADVL